MTTEFWNQRYSAEESAYGKAPNLYFKKIIDGLPSGKLLLPCEGEGRNAIYAASKGWKVDAFDQSIEGKNRADQWASELGVSFNFIACHLEDISYPEASFDAVAMIYTHFPPTVKKQFHQKLARLVKPGGHLIIEGFSKDHVGYRQKNPSVGGPPDPEFLYSTEELRDFFPDFEVIELEQVETELNEGLYHVGLSSVIRYVGRRIK